MDPDLLHILLVLSPVLALGSALVWWSARRRAAVRAGFARDGWTVFTEPSTLEATAALDPIAKVLSGIPQAAWGTKGLSWFATRPDPATRRPWILAQYQHLSMPMPRYPKPVPMAIAGILSPALTAHADIRPGPRPGILFRDLGSLFKTPAPSGDPEFDARWTVRSPDPTAALATLTPARRAWLQTLPAGWRCVLVPGAVLILADRWFDPGDIAPLRRSLEAFPG